MAVFHDYVRLPEANGELKSSGLVFYCLEGDVCVEEA